MELLLVSNEDTCRTRIAQELLYSFGRGFNITTAGVSDGTGVPDKVQTVMQEKGYEISRKKPKPLSSCTGQTWDLVLALSKEAEEELKEYNLQTEHLESIPFDDPFENPRLDEAEQEMQIRALYEDMYKRLYEFYRDILSELVLPRCTCGANTYCRCE